MVRILGPDIKKISAVLHCPLHPPKGTVPQSQPKLSPLLYNFPVCIPLSLSGKHCWLAVVPQTGRRARTHQGQRLDRLHLRNLGQEGRRIEISGDQCHSAIPGEWQPSVAQLSTANITSQALYFKMLVICGLDPL